MDGVIAVSSVSFVLGYQETGEPAELRFASSANRVILVLPSKAVLMAVTHPVSGEKTVHEFFPGKFYGWSYVPILDTVIETTQDGIVG